MARTYKELLMKRDAFIELRNKIQRELSAHPDTSGGEILVIEICPDTGDLLVTGQYATDPTEGFLVDEAAVQRMDNRLNELLDAPTGSRSAALHRFTFLCVQEVADGRLHPTDVRQRCIAAGRTLGLGEHEIRTTIHAAFQALDCPGVAVRTHRITITEEATP